jgi:hypothetical protein
VIERRSRVAKSFLIVLRGFTTIGCVGGGGGGVEDEDVEGADTGKLGVFRVVAWALLGEGGGGGVRGIFESGIVELEVGEAGVAAEVDVMIGTGGTGSLVLRVAEPGSTIGFDSCRLGFLMSA